MFPRLVPTLDCLRKASILSLMRYQATPATTQFRHSLAQGIVLTDNRRLGPLYIQAHLNCLFHIPRWSWIARELPNHQFLVAPPDLNWRAAVLRERQLIFGDIPFPVQAYEYHRFNNGRRFQTYWIQVFDFLHDLWNELELNQLA